MSLRWLNFYKEKLMNVPLPSLEKAVLLVILLVVVNLLFSVVPRPLYRSDMEPALKQIGDVINSFNQRLTAVEPKAAEAPKK